MIVIKENGFDANYDGDERHFSSNNGIMCSRSDGLPERVTRNESATRLSTDAFKSNAKTVFIQQLRTLILGTTILFLFLLQLFLCNYESLRRMRYLILTVMMTLVPILLSNCRFRILTALTINLSKMRHRSMLILLIATSSLLLTSSIVSVDATAAKHSIGSTGGGSAGEQRNYQHTHNHRQTTRSEQLTSTATSISSPNYLYATKLNHALKPSPLTAVAQQITSSDILAQYSLQNGSYFTHMTFDRRNSMLYAGASNRILQLNYNLSLLNQATTGPKADSPQCHGVCPEDTETLETTNHNKILVVNEAGSTLITCGSVMQGSCYIYPLGKFPHSPEYINIPLAANDEFATTLAFIGPSRYNAWKKEDVLYVGATFTNVGDYRHEVPAISSRRLDDLNFAQFSFQQSILNIDVNHRDHFLVDYKYGFNTSEYAYFVVVQKKSHLAEEAGFVTRLARVCVSDPNYDSYTEITLQCKKRVINEGNDVDTTEINYNILRDAKVTPAGQRLAQQMGIKRDDQILVTVFSPAKEITNEPQSKSALCLYSLKDIDEIFTENIHMCFNGTTKDRNMGYISGTINDGKCPVVGSIGNVYNFCSVGLKISGVAPIVSYSLFDFDNESITSITAAITGPHTLAFLGTANGSVKKVLLSGPNPGEYESIEIDPGHTILPDTMMSPKQDYLYVLSKQKITKLRVEHCGIYTNCSSCLESRDPFCGWCSLEKRCTIRNACQKDTSASRWLSLGTGQQCIDFEMVLPNKIPINQMTSVQLVIRTLPELPINAKYKCVFGNSTPIDAIVLENGLSCQTPPVINRPIIPAQSDHVLVPLSVRSSETNKDFVSRSFAFFDCSRHDACRRCVQSEWKCNWCIYDNRCVHNTTTCRNTASVISQSVSCPHYKPSGNNEPILLANKVPKEIKLEIENLPRPQSAHTGFLCIVNIEGAHMSLPARVESKKFIVCEKTPYTYEAMTNEYEARVDILWNRNHYIDTVPIILYKCDVLGSHREHADCSLCVTRAPKYQCTWCGNSCIYNETCSSGMAVSECPRPRIDMIKPLSGPMEGGTLITIEGSNLGIREEDVRDNIRIGDIPCELVNYEISVKIECRTGPVGYELLAPIKVGNDAGFTESSVKFHYKDIQLDGLMPARGPQSGGTKLSIIGKWLNIGSSITAFLDNYECAVNGSQASSSRLTCITSAARHPQQIRVLTLIIDGANRTFTCRNLPSASTLTTDFDNDLDLPRRSPNNFGFNGSNFVDLVGCSIYNYTTDPKIMQIKPLKSFSSGGRMITVHGTNLDSIQKPELEVFLNDELVNRSICTVITPNQMECPSPAINGKFMAYRRQIELLQQQVAVALPTASIDKLPHMNTVPVERRKRQNSYTDTIFTTIGYYTSSASSAPWSSSPIIPSSIYVDGIGATSATALASTSADGVGSNGLSTSNDIAASLKIHETQLSLQVSFAMDNVQSVRDLNKHFLNLRSTIVYVDDPVFFAFPNNIKLYKGDTLVIEGENLNIASDESDVNVTIGQKQCNVTSLALTQLVCTPPEQQPEPTDELGIETSMDLPLVVVHVGRSLRFPIGHLKYELLKPYTFSHAIVGIAVGCAIIVCLLFIILIVYRRKSTQAEREYKRIQIQMDTLESNVRMECKQAFAELQTDMTDLTADLENSGIPTLDHINYIMKVFFPGVSDHPILNSPKLRINTSRTNYDTAMIQFEQLINNKIFLLTFIETLEAQKSFNIRDKVNVASLLMIVLMNKMDYATDILKCLLLRLIDKSVMTKHPQLMLRRTESVVEKMLTNYMAICMYDYLKEYAGSSLFLLFKAIKHQIEKGLVDACTHEARYSLSEEKLLREQIVHSPVTLHIVQEDLDEKIQCKVLDCDTISQVKSKILDGLFKNTPFSMRPSVHEVDLEWRHGRGGHLTLQDEDLTTKTIANQWKRLNTLAHYGVKESAVMSLIVRQSNTEIYNNSYNAKQHHPNHNHGYYINNSQSHIIINSDLDGLQSPAVTGIRYFHLVKPLLFATNIDDHHLNIKNMAMSIGVIGNQGMPMLNSTSAAGVGGAAGGVNERTHKAIPEIFLTRLLATKGTIQKFVDDFFATILTVNDELPPAVKWLFDLLDEAAHRHGIADMEIVHAWKSNSLPLRFWVNFIKNPDFIFDINKTTTVDACLSVIAQTFMDACSTTEHRLGKDSPSNKLLFAKDIPQYREMVKQFYREVAHLPQITDHAIGSIMQQLSIHNEFDTIAALKELYIYVTKYRDQILDALNNDSNCIKGHLAHKLENVACTLEGEETSAC